MNLPNKLTTARIAMIPLFLFFFYAQFVPLNYFFALLVFVVASITDSLDGKIARKRGLVTDFGKLLDPLADKLLVMSALVSLIPVGMVHAVIVIIILAREFTITGMRQLAAGKGIVLAADKFGKIKTVFQIIWICYDLLYLSWMADFWLPTPDIVVDIGNALHWLLVAIALILTILSGANYIWKNRAMIADAGLK